MTGPLRPTYSEGQILGASDLNAQLTYERLGAVLHDRTEHLWGVAQGLALTATSNTDTGGNKFVDVSLSPGRAVDRLGRSIVATTAVPLDPAAFLQQIANPGKTDFFPVFIQAIDVPQPGSSQPGKCAVSLTTRIEESLQVSFGNPGSEIAILDQDPATVDEGFGTPGLADKVLVGWVQFAADPVNKFTAVAARANGIAVRYVGVVASDVVAGGGALTLHTRSGGARFTLSLAENPSGGCLLAFGKQDGANPIVPTFSVDEKGNVTYAGTLSPAPVSKTQAESGIAYDGVRLPLPAGVTEDQFAQGKVRAHILVTPWPHPPTRQIMPDGKSLVALPFVETCSVDDDRTVRSSIRWVDPANADTNYVVLPSACSYLLVASGQ